MSALVSNSPLVRFKMTNPRARRIAVYCQAKYNKRCEEVLEAVVSLGSGHHRRQEVAERAGYVLATVTDTFTSLSEAGLIALSGSHVYPTEKGKIAFAILLGKRTRAQFVTTHLTLPHPSKENFNGS